MEILIDSNFLNEIYFYRVYEGFATDSLSVIALFSVRADICWPVCFKALISVSDKSQHIYTMNSLDVKNRGFCHASTQTSHGF